MPKGFNQKLKLYYLCRIMTEKTDDKEVVKGFKEEMGYCKWAAGK